MSDSENDPLSSLLSSFALGPAWARAAGNQPDRTFKPDSKAGDRSPRRDDRRADERGGGQRSRDGGNRSFQGRAGKFDDRRDSPPRNEEVPPAEGVRVTLIPDPQAVHLIGKEIHQVARVYPLFDVAKILLAERARCRAVFEAPAPHAPLLRGKLDDSIFLTREEALRHLWQSDLRHQFIEEETITVDPPTGNFQAVARCGLSGEWLGPPNFHAYQINLRRLHRERFSNMPFAAYSAKVRTERGEEAVNAWLETTKQKTRWRLKGDADDAWIDDLAEAQRTLAGRCFDQTFAEMHTTEVLASIPATNLSPELFTSLKIAGNHARNHPAILIPAVCRAIEAEYLPVFKRQGKLLTGPARPNPLPQGVVLAARPGIMVDWIRSNKPAKLEGLWQAVLPEGGTAPPAEFAADPFWLLHQGHILLFTDDTLYVQELRDAQASGSDATPKTKKTKKKKTRKPKLTTDPPAVPTTVDAADPTDAADVAVLASTEVTTALDLPVTVPPAPPVCTAVEKMSASVEPARSENGELPTNSSPGVDVSPAL